MTNEFEFETSDDVDSGPQGNWLKEIGTYHLVITDVETEVVNKDKQLIPGAFKVDCVVAAGTTEGQKGKTTDVMFFSPNLNKSVQSQAFSKRKLTKFFIATNQIREDLVGGKKAKVKFENLKGQHFIATFEFSDETKKYVDIEYDNIWHVDDPEAANFPKCADSLKLIEADCRRSAESFAKGKKAAIDEEKKESVPAGISDDDLDDI